MPGQEECGPFALRLEASNWTGCGADAPVIRSIRLLRYWLRRMRKSVSRTRRGDLARPAFTVESNECLAIGRLNRHDDALGRPMALKTPCAGKAFGQATSRGVR